MLHFSIKGRDEGGRLVFVRSAFPDRVRLKDLREIPPAICLEPRKGNGLYDHFVPEARSATLEAYAAGPIFFQFPVCAMRSEGMQTLGQLYRIVDAPRVDDIVVRTADHPHSMYNISAFLLGNGRSLPDLGEVLYSHVDDTTYPHIALWCQVWPLADA
jgi:hypothetical protein